MQYFLFLFLFCFFPSTILSQENRLNGIFVTPELGLLQYEKENTFRSNAYSIGSFIGKEFSVGKKASLATGIKLETLYGNHLNYSFISNFINIPVLFRYYAFVENNSTVFAGVGVENKYKIKEVFENLALDSKYKGETGYHLGSIVELGYRTEVTDKMDLLFGFNFSGDFLNAGYDSEAYKTLNAFKLFIGIEIFSDKNK